MMSYSKRCLDLETRWDRTQSRCVQCIYKPGHKVTPNCGYDDDGGRHELSTKKCDPNTFNDGSKATCQNCTQCPPGFNITTPCSLTTDTQCQKRNPETDVPVTETTTPEKVSLSFSKTSTVIPEAVTFKKNQEAGLTPTATTLQTFTLYSHPSNPDVQWAVPLAILMSVTLVLSACVGLFYMKRKRGQHTVLSYSRRSSYINAGFAALSDAPGATDLGDILGHTILSAPLQTVLDNLDVLEELVILLDPESHGVKNTKHLASHCSFTSSWITYTYSMKDSKSPLKAVLEGVTSKHPEWTVGHLATLLRQMERNDAVSVLAKLSPNEITCSFPFDSNCQQPFNA